MDCKKEDLCFQRQSTVRLSSTHRHPPRFMSASVPVGARLLGRVHLHHTWRPRVRVPSGEGTWVLHQVPRRWGRGRTSRVSPRSPDGTQDGSGVGRRGVENGDGSDRTSSGNGNYRGVTGVSPENLGFNSVRKEPTPDTYRHIRHIGHGRRRRREGWGVSVSTRVPPRRTGTEFRGWRGGVIDDLDRVEGLYRCSSCLE